jgi:rhamnogalacturonan endolyase
MFGSETLVTMYDDGPSGGHGDAVAGDLTFTALIPTTSLIAGQMLRWRVIATDTSSIQSTDPAYLSTTDSDQYYGTVALDGVSTQLPMYYFFVNGYQMPTNTTDDTTVDTDAGARGDFFYNNELYDNVLIRIKGYTTRDLFKRSHRIDFNDSHQFLLEDGDQRRGSIAFDAEYVDPSYIRQYLSMWLFNASGTPAPVDFPVRLQMNGDFWQLAFCTEPLGTSLLKRLGIDPNDTMYSMVGQFTYPSDSRMTQETPKEDVSKADYNTVAAAISSSHTVAQLSQALFDYFDVSEVINYIAMARITQQNDDVWANMAIYCNTDGDGLWRVMPYDLNLSFGQLYYADHSSTNGVLVATDDYNKSHPLYGSSACLSYGTSNYNMLYNAIIQVPETREMLLRRERTLMDQFLQAPGTPYSQRVIETKIDEVVALIQQEANMDRAKWGWPPVSGPYGLGNVTFSQAISDLKTLFLDPARTHLYVTHSVDNTSKTIGIGNANNAGIPHTQLSSVAINITEADVTPVSGNQDEEYIKLYNPNSVAVDISGWTLTGGIEFTFASGTIIPAGGSLYVSPNVKAFLSRSTSPTGGQRLFVVGSYDGHLSALGETIQLKNSAGDVVSSYTVANTASAAQKYLRITEVNYHPTDPPTGSSYTQDDFEFIEILNTSNTVTVSLAGVHFSRDISQGTGIEFDFSDCGVTSLAPGQYIVLAKNPTALATRYNLTGVTVVGPYTGVLSNSADTICLYDSVNETINKISYQDSDPWPGRADGKGFTLEIINPLGNDNDPGNWRSSSEYLGTPGHAGVGPIDGVVVNEVLSHDDYPLYDSIELYNTTGAAIDISGWYLSDSSDDYQKYRIPNGTVLGPHEYRVFTEEQFGISVFSGDTQPGDGDAKTQDSGATLYLTGSTWRKMTFSYTVTANTMLEFDYMSTKEGTIQGIGFDEDNLAGSNRLFRLYGTTTWGISNYATYSGSTWKHYTITVGSFYTGSMAYLVFANGDTANDATSYFKNVKVYESTAGSAINFDKYFSLSSTGDDVWLMQANAAGNLTYFADHVGFGAAKNGESFGRWPNATGDLYPMQNRTLGQANDAGGNSPRIGPLVISEVMYHPSVGEDENADNFEYIEIYNPTDAAVDLLNWKIASGVDFTFASSTTIGAHQALLILPFDPSDPLKDILLANFKSKYNIGSSVKMVGGFSGHLANEGETVQLLEADGSLEDEVRYDDASPWPTAADGGGSSLQRVAANDWGDDAASWIAADPTPGTAQVSAVTGRHIFYNNSKFDSASDDNAIATDKQALLPGQTATFANYTSYSRGINGIIIDILYPTNPTGITAADFLFKVGNGSGWTDAPAPTSVAVRQVEDGSYRVTIIWADGAIQNQWLQVTVKANTNTGLSAADVFYFGNAVGESGDSTSNAVVDAQDEINSRTNKTGFSAAAITNLYDYNRDGKVNATDDLIARHNRTDGVVADPLQLIAAPALEEIITSQLLALAAETATLQAATEADVTMQPATAALAGSTTQDVTESVVDVTALAATTAEEDTTTLAATAAEEDTTAQTATTSEDSTISQSVTTSDEDTTTLLVSSADVATAESIVTAAEATMSVSARQMEYLDRGIVAVQKTTTQVYIGWRLLGTDPSNIAFNLYRSANGGAAVKLNSSPLTVTTDFLDSSATLTQSNSYYVRPVVGGVEQAPSESYTLAASSPVQQFLSVPLQIPAGVTTPDGVTCTYSANDCSVGDLDGDGQYEIIVKWDPSNSQDNANSGYTGNVYLDAYKLDGTRLWRIDLGKNIRAGAHYTQFMVYDLDGDGRAEVACKTAPYTKDGLGNYVLLGNDQLVDYRNSAGRILSGPEYLTIFNGMTGAAMATTNYLPARGNVSSWGDSYGNRVDRFLACVAYLDGVRPSLVMCRGYYTRAVLVAWDWRNGQLTQRWTFDSNTPGNGGYAGQGNHNLSVGDVDGDGKDEIIYGACAIDDNGTGLYTTGLGHGDAMQMSDMDPNHPGEEVFDVHESSGSYGIYGGEFRAAGTGQEIYGIDGHGGDVGRGNAFDIDPNYPGFESWTSADGYIYDAQGNAIYAKPSNMFINFGIWWDADPLRELLDGTTISDWNYTTHGRVNLVYAPAGVAANNGTKNTPCLVADILGDWREEVIWRTTDSSALQIWTTTISATNRIYTLMDDTQYRESVAFQNVAYNQPTATSFYLGYGMSTPPTPNIYLAGSNHVPPTVIGTTPSLIDSNGTAGARVTQIVVNFSEQLNATDAKASGNYELRRAVNGVFGDGNDVVYTLTPNYFYNSQTGASTTTFDLGVVLPADTYRLTIRASGGAGGLRDINGNYLDGDENDLAGGDYIRTFTILPVTIADRKIFYNNSKFDAASDDGAIATDKTALLPSHTATFASYTSYSLGINGIMVDIQNLANPTGLNATDFQFKMGNDNNPDGPGWTLAPAPISVDVRQGQGIGGSDRVTIIWDEETGNSIKNQWLQVTVKANTNTGLSAADVFYFGNAVGESGDNSANAVVDSQDEINSRDNKTGFSAAAITNPYDYNRDGKVNSTDDLIARHNASGSNPLQLISPPAGATLSAGDALLSLTLSEDNATSQSEALPAETAAFQSAALSATVEITPLPLASAQTNYLVPTLQRGNEITSFPRSIVGTQFPGALHTQNTADNSTPFSTSLNTEASDIWIPTQERGNQTSTQERWNQKSLPASSQYRLHDAVFAHSPARFSFTEYDGLSDDSSAPADIDTYLSDSLSVRFDKSLAHAIDNVFAAARHKKD